MNNKNIKEKIDKDFCFNLSVISSIKKYNEALHLFNSLYDKARQLTDDFDIFLDTSVLIDYYQISFSERTDFKKIIENYKSRIFLTSQIEKEFLSIRVGKIKNFNKRLNISILQNF